MRLVYRQVFISSDLGWVGMLGKDTKSQENLTTGFDLYLMENKKYDRSKKKINSC